MFLCRIHLSDSLQFIMRDYDMHGLSRDVDLSFLCGQECIQVCVGMYQVILHLGESVHLSIESRCRLNGAVVKKYDRLCRLVGQTVVEAQNEGCGSIAIKFSKGDILEITDDNQSYESYQISAPGIAIIV
ncbi:MAG TPA: hypothetical protein VFF52_14455 [Isosphaeraceae bacterium]|nr:hypothetical protein [Isosphaeraceae bacterium]